MNQRILPCLLGGFIMPIKLDGRINAFYGRFLELYIMPVYPSGHSSRHSVHHYTSIERERAKPLALRTLSICHYSKIAPRQLPIEYLLVEFVIFFLHPINRRIHHFFSLVHYL